MIGALVDWGAEVPEVGAVRRFVGALGAGLRRKVANQTTGAAILSGVPLSGKASCGWRARPIMGGGWLAFTGFIANADALARDLDLRGADDADLYAAGYAQWGDIVDLRALGEFATIVVPPNERRVRAVRSPILAPPLHVRCDRNRLVVASTPRAVLAGFDLPAEIDEQKIADSLYLNYAETERGWYKGVARIDVGTRVWIGPGSIVGRRYYDLLGGRAVRLRRDADYVEAANALLSEGVRSVLAGRDRPAVSLSGGLDSQAVAAGVIALRPDQPLLGLTSVPAPAFKTMETVRSFEDERAHVAALAALYPQLDSRLIDAADLPLDHKLGAMFLMAGAAPRNVLNFPWLHAVHEQARATGCDVLLTGAMGNLGFSFDGSGALPSWLVRGRWPRLARELRCRQARERFGFAHVAARDGLLPLLPRGVQARLRRTPAVDPLTGWSPIAADYADRMEVRARRGPIDDAHWPNTLAHRRATLATAGELGDIRQGFEAIHGLPMRDPTAYRPLLEFCVGLPDDQYLRNGCSRWLARRMLRGRIPNMVVDETRRGRQAADAPVRLGRIHAELAAELKALARDPVMAARFDLSRLQAMLASWTPGVRFNREQSDTLRLALPRTISTARFIRYIEGGNA